MENNKVLYFGYYSRNDLKLKHAGNILEKKLIELIGKQATLKYYSYVIGPRMKNNSSENSEDYKEILRPKYFGHTIWFLKTLRETLRETKTDTKVTILTYNSALYFSLAILFTKLFRRNADSVLLMFDLPRYLVYKFTVKTIIPYLISILEGLLINIYNKSIVLTENVITASSVKPYLNLKPAYYLESLENVKKKAVFDVKNIKLGYFGSLENYNSIPQMLRSIEFLNNNYSLYVYGRGELDSTVERATKMNSKIHFGGFIQDNENKDSLIKSMDLLLFFSDEQILHKNQFPSKIYEYLSSGVPILTNRFGSLSEELLNFVNVIDDNDPKNIASSILKLTSSEKKYRSLEQKAEKGRIFLKENNTFDSNSSKIMNFIFGQ